MYKYDGYICMAAKDWIKRGRWESQCLMRRIILPTQIYYINIVKFDITFDITRKKKVVFSIAYNNYYGASIIGNKKKNKLLIVIIIVIISWSCLTLQF